MKTIPDLMAELAEGFSIEMLDEAGCRDWFLEKIHPDGARCPECGQDVTGERRLERFWNMLRVTCPSCSRTFSAVTGTALNGIGIEWRALYVLLFMVSHGAKANNIAKQLGISNGAAYQWANKAKGKSQTHE